MKIRKTFIQCYASCPRFFKKKFILKLDESEEVGERAQLGKSFHAFAFDFYDRIDWDEMLYLYTLDDILQYFRSKYQQELDQAYSELRFLMFNFFSFEAERFSKIRDLGKQYFFPLEREYHIETDTLEGTLDRLDLLQNNNVCPLEYKVTEHWQGFWKTFLRRELVFYCVLLNATEYRKRCADISAYNPLLNDYFRERVRKRSKTALINWMMKLKESCDRDEFPKRISGLCRYCFDQQNCLAEEEIPELEPENYTPEDS